MKKKYILGVWGQFGDGEVIADGQAVRSNIILDELKQKFDVNKIYIVNSNNWIRNPLKLLYKTLVLLFKSEYIILLPALNGLKVLIWLINFVCIFGSMKIIYIVIGGFLPKIIENKISLTKTFKKFLALFVQTNNLKSELNKLGLSNVYILENLKVMDRVTEEYIRSSKPNMMCCTISRVCFEKGIEDAIEGVKIFNKLNNLDMKLHIYGVISKDFSSSFNKLLEINKEFVEYKGILKYNEISHVIKDYFSLIHATFYDGEGFSGNLIDAFYSGIPIIATDWMYNSEIVVDNINGKLVSVHNPNEIAESIRILYEDDELLLRIRLNNRIKSFKYTNDKVLKDLYKLLKG